MAVNTLLLHLSTFKNCCCFFVVFFFSCSVLDGVFSEAFKISKNVEVLISYVHQELSHSLLEQTVLKVDLEIIKIVGKNLKAVGKI